MSDHDVRLLRDDELRAADTLFRAALHLGPLGDDEWEQRRGSRQPERAFGAFDDVMIGTARSLDAELTVPGGAQVPAAMVTDVGVRADRTRRGVLTSLMRAQLTEFAERGMVVAALHASEGAIYGRFGYGVAVFARGYAVNRRTARLNPGAAAGGEVELAGADAVTSVLPGVYEKLSRRSGMLTRPVYWWRGAEAGIRKGDEPLGVALHHGPDGIDGYVMYRVSRIPGGPGTLRTLGLHYDNPGAFAGLWRFLLGVDLVDAIEVDMAPLDEPVELLFTDPRACRVTSVWDDLWVRLVDVPGALAARDYEGEPVVIEVDDPLLVENSGRYLVGPGEVRRTEQRPALRLGVDALAMMYLGAWRPSALVATGRAEAGDESDVARADRLFHTTAAPWCGTFF